MYRLILDAATNKANHNQVYFSRKSGLGVPGYRSSIGNRASIAVAVAPIVILRISWSH